MIFMHDLDVAEYHRKDILREAQRDSIARQAEKANRSSVPQARNRMGGIFALLNGLSQLVKGKQTLAMTHHSLNGRSAD